MRRIGSEHNLERPANQTSVDGYSSVTWLITGRARCSLDDLDHKLTRAASAVPSEEETDKRPLDACTHATEWV